MFLRLQINFRRLLLPFQCEQVTGNGMNGSTLQRFCGNTLSHSPGLPCTVALCCALTSAIVVKGRYASHCVFQMLLLFGYHNLNENLTTIFSFCTACKKPAAFNLSEIVFHVSPMYLPKEHCSEENQTFQTGLPFLRWFSVCSCVWILKDYDS